MKVFSPAAGIAVLVMTLSSLSVVAPAQAVTATVTSSADSGAGTLREAAASRADTITIAAGVNPRLTSEVVFNAATPQVTVTGTGSRTTVIRQTVSGQRVLRAAQTNLTLLDLTVTGGDEVATAGETYGGLGGGVLAKNVVLRRVAVQDNRASNAVVGAGGGVHSLGTLLAERSTISGNTLVATREASGGGTFSQFVTQMDRTTVTGNQARTNGAPDPRAIAIGGGIYVSLEDATRINRSTIVDNVTSGQGTATGGNVGGFGFVSESIIAGGVPNNCSPRITSAFSLTDKPETDCKLLAGYPNLDPQMGPLTNNGGPIDTRLPGPAARDRRTDCGDVTIDQRGLPRPSFAGGFCDVGAVEVEQANRPPTATVTLSPATLHTNDTAQATITLTDADRQAADYTVRWRVGGVQRSEKLNETAGTQTFDLSAAGNGDKGQTVSVEVVPRDPLVTGAAATASTVVANTVPTATVALAPAALRTNDVATVALAGSSDADGDPVSIVRARWSVDGRLAQDSAATTFDLGQPGRDKGAVVSVLATVSDGTAMTDAPAEGRRVLNSPPTGRLELTPATLRTNTVATVKAVDLADPDGDAVTVAGVTWRVDGVERRATNGGGFDLSFEGDGDKGQTISVTANLSDGTDLSTTPSVDRVVANSAPTAAAGPSPVVRTNDVVAEVPDVSDPDGEPLTFNYAWSLDGTVVQDGPSATYDLAAAGAGGKGQRLDVKVTASDGTDDATYDQSRRIADSPPTLGALALTAAGGTETATAAPGPADADGDPVSVAWRWTLNGAPVRAFDGPGATDSVSPALVAAGGSLEVRAVPVADGVSGAERTAKKTVSAAGPGVTPTPSASTTPSPGPGATATPSPSPGANPSPIRTPTPTPTPAQTATPGAQSRPLTISRIRGKRTRVAFTISRTARVTVRVERRRGRKFVPVRRTRVQAVAGVNKVRIKRLARPGSYRVVVRAEGITRRRALRLR